MGLNIKSAIVHELARKVAAETGSSMTSAIETALREKLDRLAKQRDVDARVARVREELDELGPPPPGLSSDHSDLYDEEEGLPA